MMGSLSAIALVWLLCGGPLLSLPPLSVPLLEERVTMGCDVTEILSGGSCVAPEKAVEP